MLKFHTSLFLLLLILPSISLAKVWTSADGSKSFDASYISHNEDTVKIKKLGKIVSFKISHFSEKDIAWLNERPKSLVKKEALSTWVGIIKSHSESKADIKTWHTYLPKSYAATGQAHPVCFIYAPYGESKAYVKWMQLIADELNWVLVGIDSYTNGRAHKDTIKQVVSDCRLITDTAFEKLNIDADKIVYSGFSGGGRWSYYSSHSVKKAAGIISYGGWLSKEYHQKYPEEMAVAIVNGDQDSNARDWENKDMNFLVKTRKATAKQFHFPGAHTIAPPKLCLEAAKWVHELKGF